MTAILIIIGAVAVIMLISAIDCALHIDVTDYQLDTYKLKCPVKLVCISDLHGWQYGRGNSKLLALIEAQKPDAIIIAGDMITRRAKEKQIRRVLAFIHELTGIAPVYYATGNHEADYMAENGMKLLNMVAETGAEVLYDRLADVKIGYNTLRIGGASGRYFDGSERDSVTLDMLREIGADDTPSIAVVHQPENLLDCEDRRKWTADLYLSGHTHGGVWRVPFGGGVMAPSQGLFPKYDRGQFLVDGKMNLIINAGLAGYYFIPRVFNHPEICVIDIP